MGMALPDAALALAPGLGADQAGQGRHADQGREAAQVGEGDGEPAAADRVQHHAQREGEAMLHRNTGSACWPTSTIGAAQRPAADAWRTG